MQNYKLQQKIIKTKPVTYYHSTHKQTNQNHIIKKLNKSTTWQNILQNKIFSIIKQSKCKYFAKIKQIIKEDDNFYCVMEFNQINMTKIIANQIDRKDIYKIAKQLIQLINELSKEKILIRDIRPSHIFFNNNKNNLKIYHFQTFTDKDYTQLDLTQIQDLRYISPEEILTRKGFDEKCSIFTVGLIICQLIIGYPLIKAKNKLQYIYQLTQLFPNQRIDKMQGSQHQFKHLQKGQTFIEKIRKEDISHSLASLLQQMLKINHAERIQINQILSVFDQVIGQQQKFQKNKSQTNLDTAMNQKPNKNQVNVNSSPRNIEIQFEFQNKPTLSILPQILNQKIKQSSTLPFEQNIQEDLNQPIIIKQSSNSNNGMKNNRKISQQKETFQRNQFQQNNSNFPMNQNKSNSNSGPNINMNNNKLMPLKYNQLKNSRSTKQTLSTTIKKPQLTNYALNQANLGVKLGMNNTLFSQNQNDF